MAVDLSGLERAAADAGLPGLTARIERFDRRRAGWFRWTDRELLVNERVVERLGPDDGAALLVHAVIEARHLARWRRNALLLSLLVVAIPAVLMGLGLLPADGAGFGWPAALAAVVLLGGLVLAVVTHGAALQAADDQAVEALGDPERLVHALNAIHQDELHLAGRRFNARPDVHARAERLVDKHQLRLAPERRNGCGGPPADG